MFGRFCDTTYLYATDANTNVRVTLSRSATSATSTANTANCIAVSRKTGKNTFHRWKVKRLWAVNTMSNVANLPRASSSLGFRAGPSTLNSGRTMYVFLNLLFTPSKQSSWIQVFFCWLDMVRCRSWASKGKRPNSKCSRKVPRHLALQDTTGLPCGPCLQRRTSVCSSCTSGVSTAFMNWKRGVHAASGWNSSALRNSGSTHVARRKKYALNTWLVVEISVMEKTLT
mmetsp:Transcript_39996/g.127243  ORF Transcript_39996/g.127243 Transcript_39996/m.127243 type:complete len:228 (-) Transcript_39996:183-866(-)